MNFEEVKEMFKKSIDTTDTMNQAIENLIQSIYLKGYNDALKHEQKIGKWIANGTPLPKHHGRLIDADMLRKNWVFGSREKIEIDAAPTIIPATKEGDGEC